MTTSRHTGSGPVGVPGTDLPRSFYDRDARKVAPELVGRILVANGAAVRIVEVEAYLGAEDPAAHSYRGPTPRTATMFGPPGHLYVYFIYGMHWCANLTCGGDVPGAAVLIRAGEPVAGIELMRARRPTARRDRDLCAGPARLTRALAIDGSHDGVDVVAGERGIRVVDDGRPPPDNLACSVRVGISRATDRPWRWYLAGDVHVSGRPR